MNINTEKEIRFQSERIASINIHKGESLFGYVYRQILDFFDNGSVTIVNKLEDNQGALSDWEDYKKNENRESTHTLDSEEKLHNFLLQFFYKRRICLFILWLLCFFFQPAIIATAQSWRWAKSAGGNFSEKAYSVATDASGNIYVTGAFGSSSINFDTVAIANYNTNGSDDIFIAKYDSSGNILWAKSAGGSSFDMGYSIATDVSGNFFVIGSFQSPTLTFDSITLVNSNAGSSDIFIVKYNTNGNVIWAQSIMGSAWDHGRSISTDSNGNIFVTGSFGSPTLTVGSTSLVNTGVLDLFIVKYDSGGNVLWVKSEGGSAADGGSSVSADTSGNIYMTGGFSSPTITFGSTTLTNTDTSFTSDVFLVKYNTDGNVLWAKSAGGSYGDAGASVSVDLSGNALVTGYFGSSSINFDTIAIANSNTDNSNDIFITKYDSSGNVLWAKSAVGSADEQSFGISTDSSGNVFVTGNFRSPTLTFGTISLTNAGGGDIFFVKYDALGNIILAQSISASSNELGSSISVDESGNVFVTGYFWSSTITFGSTSLGNAGTNDIFIAKFGACSAASSTLTVISCGSYTLNAQTYTTSGTYTQNLIGCQGYDSTITLNLTINPIPTIQLILSPDTVYVNAAGYPLTGGVPSGGVYSGTGVSGGNFNPGNAGAGLHNIIYTYTDGNNCTNSDTSQLFVDQPTGILGSSGTSSVFVIPNPSSGLFTVQSVHKMSSLSIFNILGEKIYSTTRSFTKSTIIDLSNQPTGIYFYEVTTVKGDVIGKGKLMINK
ncbi:MAG: SBBP repeat-containing protein [Flavobacteriales bacterium]|nr:SBBP repeat-containing protein [Flavobacteriales bacterium]